MLGDKIKSIRLNKNISAKKLSESTGLTQAYLSMLENNKRKNPSTEVLQKIADALDVSVNDFFDNIINHKEEKIENPIKQNLSFIPQQFTNPNEAREYINKHQIFGFNGFNSNKLDDNEILEFANELLKQMELISFKYKK